MAPPVTAQHGTTVMYNYHGCRCAQCKAYRNALTRKYYANLDQAGKVQRITGARDRRRKQVQKNRALINELKSQPCTDCGGSFPPCVMQFDHLRDKEFSIAPKLHLATGRLLREIAKCEIVCTNCHAIRTFMQRELCGVQPLGTSQEAITTRQRRIANRELMNSLKAKPCMDCGNSYPPCAMHFDHRPGETVKFQPTRAVYYSREAMMAELAKCDLVCANCHTIRTILIRHQHYSKALSTSPTQSVSVI